MNKIWPYLLCSFINGGVSISLCVYVLIQNKRRSIDKAFCTLTFFLSLWGFSFLFMLMSNEQANALLGAQFLGFALFFIPSAFLHFIISFLGLAEKKKKEIFISYCISIILALFTFTPYTIVRVEPKLDFAFILVPGIVFHIYLIIHHICFLYSFYLIYKHYKYLSDNNLNQVRYIIVGSIIAFIGGSVNFLICYDIPVPPFGFFLILIYIIMFAYSVIKHQLMDIRVVIRRGTIFSAVYFGIFTVPIFLAVYGDTAFEEIFGKHWWIGFFIAGGILSYIAQMIYQSLHQKAEGQYLKKQRIYNSYLRYASNDMIRFRDPKQLQARVANVLSNDIRINHVRLFIFNPEKDIYELVAMRGTERRTQTNRAFDKGHPIVQLLIEIEENVLYENLEKLNHIGGVDINAVKEEMRALGAAIILPNISQGKLLGFIALSRTRGHQVYTKDDINVLTTLANQVALAMENALLYKDLEIKIQERTWELNNALQAIQQDLKVAKGIQEKFLSKEFETIRGLSFYIKYYPMNEIGGDLYDVTELRCNYFRIFLADATGHGIQAALATMLIKSEYDKLKQNIMNPSILLEVLNNEFLRYYEKILIFFTCIVIDIDLVNNKLIYSSAGHPDQLLITDNETVHLSKTGRIVGIVYGNTYNVKEQDFGENDKLLLYTDGIFEETNDDFVQFCESRMYECINEHQGDTVENIADDLFSRLHAFTGRYGDKFNRNDDITLLGISRGNG